MSRRTFRVEEMRTTSFGEATIIEAIEVKREFIRAAIRRATEGRYPVVEPSAEDNSRDLSWWIRVLDAKAFLFSENGSALWLFPHYELKLTPLGSHLSVSYQGVSLVDTDDAYEFHETAHPTQIYVPRAEVDFSHLERSDSLTYCPFKNIASYYNVRVGADVVTDAFWSYEEVYDTLPPSGNGDGIQKIRGMLSFYRRKLDVRVS